MEISEDKQKVIVSVRIRPVLNQDNTGSSCLQVISKEPPILLITDRPQTYHFDHIFTDEVDQETVYNETVKPLVSHVKQGYNGTVFAYGQTGTGKSYTMGTNPKMQAKEEFGLIPRTLEEFFDNHDENNEVEISVSFMEIYNEKVFDLLQNNRAPLLLQGFNVLGCSREKIFSYYEAKHFLDAGNRKRHTGETKQNANSSRSHAVFTIHCKVRSDDNEVNSKLNLVDLAGCESVKKTGNQGSTFHEGININKGLFYIGQVMTALSGNTKHVPYRQSILTTILQDSLNKQTFVSLIACVNSNPNDLIETNQTLEFAQRVKKMKVKPEVNEFIRNYKADNPALFQTGRTSCTPMKRKFSAGQTPMSTAKKINNPMSVISECSSNVELTNSPKSLFSSSVSLISNNATSNFSPVIRKYINAMESSLMTKLESVLISTLKRPSRESLRRFESEKENTPSVTWNKIHSEVSKIVKNEIASLTTAKSIPATSSPIDLSPTNDFGKICRILTFDTPRNNSLGLKEDPPISNPIGIFKIPDLPVPKNKVASKRTPSISPIENIKPRRSVRLSLKRAHDDTLEDSLSESSYLADKRKSARLSRLVVLDDRMSCLQSKKSSRQSTKLETNETDRKLSNDNDENSSLEEFPDENLKRRVSRRLVKKIAIKTPKIVNRSKKYLIDLENSKGDSPNRENSRRVLNCLNSDSLREIQSLHSIGPKTAQQIALFRKLNGRLKTISDLSKMPGWRGKKFDKFLEQNFLKKD